MPTLHSAQAPLYCPTTAPACQQPPAQALAPLAVRSPHSGQGFTLASRVVLAPMAGVTDVVFRALVRRFSPKALICTEMISSNALVYSKRWNAPILAMQATDEPIAYQLAAHRVEVLVEAAQGIVQRHNPQSIDLNMGCPVKKITGNFEGCSLMRDLDLAAELIGAVSRAVSVPVTVKFRLGWDDTSKNYVDFGQMAQDAGAAMVTLHARTRAQGYKPGVDWEAFGQLKQALRIPVIGNGDIITPHDAAFVLNTYGIDGVMIGRGCQGEPWRLAQVEHYLATGELQAPPSLLERLSCAWQHVVGMATFKGERHGVREMRGQLPWYIKGFEGAPAFRGQLTQVGSVAEVAALLHMILEKTEPELARTPQRLPWWEAMTSETKPTEQQPLPFGV